MTINELRQVLDWAEKGELQYKNTSNLKWYDVSYNEEIYGHILSKEPFDLYRRKPSEPKLIELAKMLIDERV